MPRLKNTVPKYRKHRASGQAVVTLGGRDYYLGPHGTKASRIEYDRLIGEWLQGGRMFPKAESGITVVEIIAKYLKWADKYFRKNGKPTSELGSIKSALRFVKDLYGRQPATEFGPIALQTVQQRMVDGDLCRNVVNAHTGRVKRMFKWAVSQQLIPASVHQALLSVSGLQKDRTSARETEPIEPVDDSTVDATLEHLGPIIADMVRVQRATGARPSEVCIMRPGDIDRSGDVWEYRPGSHKTEHRGRQRIVFIGPKAQNILRPYLLRAADAYCFSPEESERNRRAEQHANRKTPLSCGNRPGSNRSKNPKRPPAAKYDHNSYRRAIHRACDKAGIERWSPNRLRHSAATEIRKRFGLEAAQTILGHANMAITEVYAETDQAKARDIAREVG